MKDKDVRRYGEGPFSVAVIHGGPGAPGEMKPVAEELSSGRGVLEPLQTAPSIEGEVDNLRDSLEKLGHIPLTLIGYSWGAWLSIIFSAIHPVLVEKVILVGCPPIKEKHASEITEKRLNRLSEDDREEARTLLDNFNEGSGEKREEDLFRFSELARKADSCDPLPSAGDLADVELKPEIYTQVWDEAREVRKSGELLDLIRMVESPIVAIHGDCDPHPAEGVRGPLSRNVEDFRFILLKECGHTPWIERNARDKFYAILEGVLG